MRPLLLLSTAMSASLTLAAHPAQPRRHSRYRQLARNAPTASSIQLEPESDDIGDPVYRVEPTETQTFGFGADWLVFVTGVDPAVQTQRPDVTEPDVQHLVVSGMEPAGTNAGGGGAQSNAIGAQSHSQPQPQQQQQQPTANPSQSSDSAGLGPQTQDEVDKWLKAHNAARAAHRAGPLQWRADLAWGAKSNAERCKEGHTAESGENIASSSKNMSADQAVAMWMDHAPLFNGKFQEETAHFSQVVWKETQYVGCFIADCNPGTRFPQEYGDSRVATCRYDPPGNNVAGSAMTDNVE